MEHQEHKENRSEKDSEIEIFLQGESIPEIIILKLPPGSKVIELIETAKSHGLPSDAGTPFLVMLEGKEELLDVSDAMDLVAVRHHSRIHIHRCKKIAVTINFNGQQKSENFPPSSSIKHVHHWAVGEKGFNLSELDATEHALQVCGSTVRPDEDTHLGTLTTFPNCSECFDLVPKKRVEG